jgi:hypothetical protein
MLRGQPARDRPIIRLCCYGGDVDSEASNYDDGGSGSPPLFAFGLRRRVGFFVGSAAVGVVAGSAGVAGDVSGAGAVGAVGVGAGASGAGGGGDGDTTGAGATGAEDGGAAGAGVGMVAGAAGW